VPFSEFLILSYICDRPRVSTAVGTCLYPNVDNHAECDVMIESHVTGCEMNIFGRLEIVHDGSF
jgi:hypothetical protein